MENKLLIFLLQNAFEIQRVSYSSLFKTFCIDFTSEEEIDKFYIALVNVEKRITKDLLDNGRRAIYSVLFYHDEDNMPDLLFYDMFAQNNKAEYRKIAGSMIPSDAFLYSDIKYQIYELAMEFLVQDLNRRFPNEKAMNKFIQDIITS